VSAEPTAVPTGDEGISILPRETDLVTWHSGCAERLQFSYPELWVLETVTCPCGQELFSVRELLDQLEVGLEASPPLSSASLRSFARAARAKLLGD
jgi:hypothetical protein